MKGGAFFSNNNLVTTGGFGSENKLFVSEDYGHSGGTLLRSI